MSQVKTILLAGGGTGGPTAPLLAMGNSLREQYPDVRLLFVGTEHGPERAMVSQEGIGFVTLPAAKLRRYFSIQNFLDLFVLPYSVVKAVSLMKKYNVDVVASAGGYVAVPVIWAAKLLRKKVLVHQQDVVPSLSNRLTKKFADTVTLTFEVQKKFFSNGIITGNPVRKDVAKGSREEAVKYFELQSGKPTVLIYGGGTGSLEINKITEKAVASLVDAGLQIIHITGKHTASGQYLSALAGGYASREFLGKRELSDAYALADIVVGRAGLGTISELSYLGKPAIIIPMPDSHQEKNAELLFEKKAAVVLDEKELTTEKFSEAILSLWKDEQKKKNISKNISEIMPHGADDTIASLVYNLAK